MDFEPDKELELWAHHQLRSLPDQPAPPQLMERVMQALDARAKRSWWRKPWLEWPRGWQFGSALPFASAVIVATLCVRSVDPGQWTGTMQQAWPGVTALVGALVILLRTLTQPVVLAGIGAFFLLYLFCFGVGAACVRVARADASE